MKTVVLNSSLIVLLVASLQVGTLAFRNCKFCGDDFITEEESHQYCMEGGYSHINHVVSNPSQEELVSSLYHSEGATITYSKVTTMFTVNKTDACCVEPDQDSPNILYFMCTHDNQCQLTRPYFIVRLKNLCIFKYNDFIHRKDKYDPAPMTMTLHSPCPFDLELGDELIVKLDLVVPNSWCPEWRSVTPASDTSCVRHQQLFKADPETLKQAAKICGLNTPRFIGNMKEPYCPGVSQNVTAYTCNEASVPTIGFLSLLVTVAASFM